MEDFVPQGSISDTLDPELVKKLKEEDSEQKEIMWARFEENLPFNGHEITEAFRSLYELYDEGLVRWMANLFDPDICVCNELYGKSVCEHHPLCGTAAFHYTHSARDTVGFLPVIEGTLSVHSFLEEAGLTQGLKVSEYFGENIGKKIVAFAKGLQDPDGYFYHPQWGKDIGIGRRARDYDRAIWTLNRYGETPIYPTIESAENNKDSSSSTLVPDHLKTVEAFKEYLDSLDIDHRSYPGGSVIAAQYSQIAARGKEFTDALGDFLDAHQRPDNGIWHEETNYLGVNGLMKISGPYCHMKRPMPNPDKAIKAAIGAIVSSEDPTSIVTVWNPWVALERVLENISKYHNPNDAENIRNEFFLLAPEAIRITKEKTAKFKKPDGSFSYNQKYATATMQGSPCGVPQTVEGDMDAAVLGTKAMVSIITDVLGMKNYRIPIYGKYEGALFMNIIKNRKPVRKYK